MNKLVYDVVKNRGRDDSVRRFRYGMCVCVCVRERDSRDTDYRICKVMY